MSCLLLVFLLERKSLVAINLLLLLLLGSVYWKHSPNQSQLRLTTFLGQTALNLTIDPSGAKVVTYDDQIFTVGLARKKQTSPALKLLSCKLQTVEVKKADGESFEVCTVLHLSCWFSAVLGIPANIVQGLQSAWPPPGDSKNKNARPEDEELFLKRVKDIYDSNVNEEKPRFCVVFRQGTPTAQGPDVFVLDIDMSNQCMRLHCFQCKNHNVYMHEGVRAFDLALEFLCESESKKCPRKRSFCDFYPHAPLPGSN